MSDETPINPAKVVEITPTEPSEKGYVVLPYAEGEFKEFIKSLLGSPQAINKTIYGSFEITGEDLRNLYELIYQRVSQQNHGILAQFKTRIVYSDNSSVEINSLAELMTYNEIKPVISQAVHLTWDFIVRFPDKSAPEKQRIQVSFVAPLLPSTWNVFTEESLGSFLSSNEPSPKHSGSVSFRIEHTARTWGADIEALLTNHIQSLIKPPSWYKVWTRRLRPFILLVLILLTFFTTSQFIDVQTKASSQQALAKVHTFFETSESLSLDKKLEFIATILADKDQVSFRSPFSAFVLVLILFGGMLMSIGVTVLISPIDPSFILFTKQSRINREQTLKTSQRKWLGVIVSILLTIMLGVISNIIFANFINR